MEKPTLVIMAAGLGSRYGGLKQIAPVDDEGHIIIDYSLYDAYRAGFRDVVCIINPKNEKDFVEHFEKIKFGLNIKYAFQTLDDIPAGFVIPDERVKPWGTAHAVLSAKNQLKGPFAVINADDFYGASAFKILYDFLENKAAAGKHSMVGYFIENTLTESGSVARGVCKANDNFLAGIREMTEIYPAPGGAVFKNADEDIHLPSGTIVSMNMWGFSHEILNELENRFAAFLSKNIPLNPLKCEYLLPTVVGELLTEDNISVEILPTVDKWFGVTYSEDMPGVRAAIKKMKQDGAYNFEVQ